MSVGVVSLSNIFDHIEDRWFVPDAQVVFPFVFLSDVGPLTGVNALYKKCFDIIRDSCNYVFLPSNISDFSNGLIMDKLRKFLGYIEYHIRKARSESWSEDAFYRRVRSYLRAIDSFGKSLGDLLIYWDSKKRLFWSYVSIDEALVKKKMVSIINERLGVYYSLCEEHEVSFSSEETQLSDGFFIMIRDARDSETIPHFANNADLMILADCVVYSLKRLHQGIVYLVTNDNGLHDTTLALVEQPNLIFPEMTSGKLTGLEPLRPNRLVADFGNR